MKVEKINQNYSAPRWQSNKKGRQHVPNFTGNPLKGQIKNQLPNKTAINIMEKLKWLKGELGGILITAIGTGAVAPIFIAYNPFVKAPKDATEEQKKDVENTKKYTAMRQPVSAVLAVIFQTSVLKPIDRGLEALFNTPKYAKNLWLGLDQSTLNKKSFLERKVKKEMKKEGLHFSSKAEFKKERDRRVEAIEAQQIGETAAKFKREGKFYIGDRIVDNKTVAELVNKSIDDYIEDARNLKTNDSGLKFYKERARILIENEETLRDLLGNLPKSEKDIADHLKKVSAGQNQDVKTILEEIINVPESHRASRCERTIERIDTIKKICDGNFSPDRYYEKMVETNNNLDNIIAKLENCKIGNIDTATEDTIQYTIKKIAEYCQYDNENFRLSNKFQSTETFHDNIEQLIKKIHKDITKGYKEVIENRYKGFNQLSKIAIGLCITLPITCTALNWVYPRFMELCFPKLAGKKDDKSQNVKNGGDK